MFPFNRRGAPRPPKIKPASTGKSQDPLVMTHHALAESACFHAGMGMTIKSNLLRTKVKTVTIP